MQFLSLLP